MFSTKKDQKMANISLPLGINSFDITAQTLDKQGNIILDVKSKRTEIPCRKCGKLINKKRGFGDVLKSSSINFRYACVFTNSCCALSMFRL